MNPIQWLINYCTACQTAVSGINVNQVVVDDSQIIKFLADQTSEMNSILLGIIPDFSPNGDSADNFIASGSVAFFVLNKTTYSEYDHKGFIDIFKDTFPVVRDLVEKMLQDSREGCDVLRYLNTNTIHILPVWNKAGCNGWQILCDIDYPLW